MTIRGGSIRGGSLMGSPLKGNPIRNSFEGSGGGPPPPVFCPAAPMVEMVEVNCSGTIASTNVSIIGTASAGQYFADTSPTFNFLLGSDITAAEITLNTVDEIGSGVGIVLGDFPTTGDGIFIIKTSPTQISLLRASDQSSLLTITLSLPYTLQITANGATGDIRYDDGVNSGLIINIPTLATDVLTLFTGGGTAAVNLSEIDYDFNFGSSAYAITPPVGTKKYCDFTPYVPPPFYGWTDFLSFGDVTYPSDRVVRILGDGGFSSGASPFFNDRNLAPTTTYTQNVFESEIILFDPEVALNFDKWGILSFDTNTSVVLEGSMFWFFSNEFPLSGKQSMQIENTSGPTGSRTYDVQIRLANKITNSLGDVLAGKVIDNGANAPTRQIIYKIGSETVITSEFNTMIEVNYESTSIGMQASIDGTPTVGKGIEVQDNGVEADYVVATYPTGSVDAFGDSMATKTAAFTPDAFFETFALIDQSFDEGSNVISGSNKISTVLNGASAIGSAYTWTSVFLKQDTGIRVIEIELTTLTATATTGYELRLDALNSGDEPGGNLTYIRMAIVGGDLVLEVSIIGVSNTELIESSYVPSAGDVWAIEVDTDGNSAIGHLYDGAVSSSSSEAIEDLSYASYVARAGHDAVPVSEGYVMTCQYNKDDMDANLKAVYATGALDLNGDTI